MYVRCLAWLHADDERTTCDFPELDNYSEWIVSTAFGIGLSSNGEPLKYADLKAWSDLSGIKLDGYDAELMHKLSIIYCACVSNYKDEKVPPYESEESEKARIKAQEAMLKASFRGK